MASSAVATQDGIERSSWPSATRSLGVAFLLEGEDRTVPGGSSLMLEVTARRRPSLSSMSLRAQLDENRSRDACGALREAASGPASRRTTPP